MSCPITLLPFPKALHQNKGLWGPQKLLEAAPPLFTSYLTPRTLGARRLSLPYEDISQFTSSPLCRNKIGHSDHCYIAHLLPRPAVLTSSNHVFND